MRVLQSALALHSILGFDDHPTKPPWESIRLRSHRRILRPILLDLRLTGAPFLLHDGVHDARNVAAAAPPRRLVCSGVRSSNESLVRVEGIATDCRSRKFPSCTSCIGGDDKVDWQKRESLVYFEIGGL